MSTKSRTYLHKYAASSEKLQVYLSMLDLLVETRVKIKGLKYPTYNSRKDAGCVIETELFLVFATSTVVAI